MKFFHDKTADISGRKVIFYAIFSFVAVIVFLIIIYIVPSYASEIARMPYGLENYLITQRFLTHPACFIFQDRDSNRVYPWVIDLEKFNEDNMNKCYSASDTKTKAYRFTLTYGIEKKTINTKNWEGFVKSGETKQVFVYDNENIKKGELFIEMQDAK